jgi:hypothetical protein
LARRRLHDNCRPFVPGCLRLARQAHPSRRLS